MDGDAIYYLVQTVSDVPADLEWLSVDERARASSYRFPKRRDDWILGRWTAKNALRLFLSSAGQVVPDYPEIEIRSAADGAPDPYLRGTIAQFALALSHSGTLGFCTVAAGGRALGCDLELVKARDKGFIHDYYCDGEIALAESAPHDRQPLMATLIWSAKESALKCLREGLRRDTRTVLIEPPGPQEPGWNPLSALCRESLRTFHGWWRTEGRYVMTILADGAVTEPIQLHAAAEGPSHAAI